MKVGKAFEDTVKVLGSAELEDDTSDAHISNR